MLKLTNANRFFSLKGLWKTIKSYQIGDKTGMKIIQSSTWNGQFEGTPNVGYSRLHKHLSNMFYYRDLTLENKLAKNPDKREIYDKFQNNYYQKLYEDRFSYRPGQIYYNKDYLRSNLFLENINNAIDVDDKKEKDYLKDKANVKKMQKYV